MLVNIGVCSVVAIIITLILFQYYKKCYINIKNIKGELEKLNESLDTINNTNATDKYEQVDKYFRDGEHVGSIWNEYSKTLVHIMLNNRHVIYSTAEASAYFNFESLTKTINITFWQNIGGIFTGIGIFGTFLGLSIGVWGIDVTSSDISVLKDGIGNLLSGLYMAFLTSLLGIASALIFNWCNKDIMAMLNLEIDKLATRMESFYQRRSSEQILADSYIQSTEQTNELKKFNTDLALSIGDALEAKFSEEVIPQFLPVLESIDAKMGAMNSFNEERLPQVIEKSLENQFKETLLPTFDKLNAAIDKLNSSGVDAISKNLQGSAGKELDNFAVVLQRMSDNLEHSLNKMKDTSSEVDKNMNTMIAAIVAKLDQNMEKVMNATEKQQQALSSVAEQVNDELKNTILLIKKDVGSIVDQFSDGAQRQKAEFDANSKKISEGIKKILEDFSVESKKQTAVILANTENMKDALDHIMKNYSEEANKLRTEHQNGMRSMNEEFLAFVKETNAEIHKHQDVLNSIAQEMKTILENTRDVMAEADDTAISFNKAAEPVSRATTSLENQLYKTVEANNALTKSIDSKMRILEATAENNAIEIRNLLNSMDKTKENWRAYSEHFEGISGEMCEVTRQLDEKIREYNDVMKSNYEDTLDRFDDSFNIAVNNLSEAIEDLGEILDNKIK